jgi:hypothetical protein
MTQPSNAESQETKTTAPDKSTAGDVVSFPLRGLPSRRSQAAEVSGISQDNVRKAPDPGPPAA